jgi:glutathione peroxidase
MESHQGARKDAKAYFPVLRIFRVFFGSFAADVLGFPALRKSSSFLPPLMAQRAERQTETTMPIYDFSARLSTGEERHLADYRDKVLLVVNVASKCGFTPQYKGLQGLYEQFGPRGFEILAFPSDQFGHQEPGSDADISAFCDRTYGITFPLFARIEVNGNNAHPLYLWLKQQKGGLLGDSIKWNFTKFLVDRTGAVRARFAPTTTPESIAEDVAALL